MKKTARLSVVRALVLALSFAALLGLHAAPVQGDKSAERKDKPWEYGVQRLIGESRHEYLSPELFLLFQQLFFALGDVLFSLPKPVLHGQHTLRGEARQVVGRRCRFAIFNAI